MLQHCPACAPANLPPPPYAQTTRWPGWPLCRRVRRQGSGFDSPWRGHRLDRLSRGLQPVAVMFGITAPPPPYITAATTLTALVLAAAAEPAAALAASTLATAPVAATLAAASITTAVVVVAAAAAAAAAAAI